MADYLHSLLTSLLVIVIIQLTSKLVNKLLEEKIMFKKKESRFDVGTIEQQGNGIVSVVTDEKTGVQYLLAIVPNMGSGMTVLVNQDGKPLIESK